jgi:hypothetical protein
MDPKEMLLNSCHLADPDRSNPSRKRLERPLDTIRAFEAAIDGTYDRRPACPSRPGTFNGQIVLGY